MKPQHLSTVVEAVVDEVKKLRNSSVLNNFSDNSIRDAVAEVMTIWELNRLRNRFFETVTDEDLSEAIDELLDSGLSVEQVAENLNRRFEINHQF